MSIEARLTRMEGRVSGIPYPKIDWQPRLARLSDAQLLRMEELFMKMGRADPQRDTLPLEDTVDRLTPEELQELIMLGEVMGLKW